MSGPENDPTFGGLLGPLPKKPDPLGTCHLVGCPDKGRVDHHVLGTTIGVPSEETWRATSQPQSVSGPQRLTISRNMGERLNAFCEALERDPGIARVHRTEARILADYLRGLL